MSEKYCVLPGQPPVRLSTTEGGHVCIVGETPREIPAIFEQEALGKGCITETMMEALKIRLQGGEPAGGSSDDPGGDIDAERSAKIRAAIVEILNSGNPSDLTNGKPKVEVVSALAGFEVTGAERDAAFNSL